MHQPINELWDSRSLLFKMAQRDINSKYYGLAFGLIWATATPMVLMGAYWYVLGRLMKASWPDIPHERYPLLLFIGIVVYVYFSEVIGRAPYLIESHKTYVKKVVFPLGILSGITTISACFHLLISLGILFAMQMILGQPTPLAWISVPLIVAPLLLMCLGLSWVISSLSVYIRDMQQVIPLLVTVAMFLSPIFFPMSGLPPKVQFLFYLNPVTVPVEQLRLAVIFGQWPDAPLLFIYWSAAIAVLLVGSAWFAFTKKGFADVL